LITSFFKGNEVLIPNSHERLGNKDKVDPSPGRTTFLLVNSILLPLFSLPIIYLKTILFFVHYLIIVQYQHGIDEN